MGLELDARSYLWAQSQTCIRAHRVRYPRVRGYFVPVPILANESSSFILSHLDASKPAQQQANWSSGQQASQCKCKLAPQQQASRCEQADAGRRACAAASEPGDGAGGGQRAHSGEPARQRSWHAQRLASSVNAHSGERARQRSRQAPGAGRRASSDTDEQTQTPKVIETGGFLPPT